MPISFWRSQVELEDRDVPCLDPVKSRTSADLKHKFGEIYTSDDGKPKLTHQFTAISRYKLTCFKDVDS